MSSVMIKCPSTGRMVSTAIETAQSVFESLPDVPARMVCPACGKEHVWTARNAWLAEGVSPAPGLVPDRPEAA
ncbi:MAG TPA: hypothetical protein VFS63_15175 [Pseudolabrys sp.]|jgi:hypothetical protein|nr:hypothetical protein [Pseudolabrys sp.]